MQQIKRLFEQNSLTWHNVELITEQNQTHGLKTGTNESHETADVGMDE